MIFSPAAEGSIRLSRRTEETSEQFNPEIVETVSIVATSDGENVRLVERVEEFVLGKSRFREEKETYEIEASQLGELIRRHGRMLRSGA